MLKKEVIELEQWDNGVTMTLISDRCDALCVLVATMLHCSPSLDLEDEEQAAQP